MAAPKDESGRPTFSTRVFKKACPNGKITTYLGRRDFFEFPDRCDYIDGVVVIDPAYIKKEEGRKVFVQLLAAFRYGREDLEMLGLTFRKDLLTKAVQVYPPTSDKPPLTRLQDRLLKKLGENAHPFLFEVPKNSPPSVSIFPAPGDSGKPCGVDYKVVTYVGRNQDDKPEKRNSLRLGIKKLSLLDSKDVKQPVVEVSKDFMLSQYPVNIEARLERELYAHGEEIKVHVNIENRSSKTLKAIKVEVKQYAEICMGNCSQFKSTVTCLDSMAGFPINPSSHMSQSYSLTPSADGAPDKRGIVLDGLYRNEDSHLAISSPLPKGASPEQKEALGICVSYKIKIKVIVQRGTDIKCSLPFRLTSMKPAEPIFIKKVGNTNAGDAQYVNVSRDEIRAALATYEKDKTEPKPSAAQASSPVQQRQQPAAQSVAQPMAQPAPVQPPAEENVGNLIDLGDLMGGITPALTDDGVPLNLGGGAIAASFNADEDDFIFEEFVQMRIEEDGQ